MVKRSHQIRPCENCPYRKDAPRRLWHRSEFEDLLASETSEFGGLYACHKFKGVPEQKRGLCAGWLLDQKKRNLPSIRLRLQLLQDPQVAKAYERVNDGGHEVFPSSEAMCRANGVRKKAKKSGT